MKDLVEFSEKHSFRIFGPPAAPDPGSVDSEIAYDVASRSTDRLSNRFRDMALDADREGMAKLLMLLYGQEQHVAPVVDTLILPTLSRLSRDTREGALALERERRASEAITEALIRWAPELHRKSANGLSAFCATPETDFNDITLRCVAYALESEGWHVHYIGPNTPFDTLASFVGRMTPHLGILTLSIPRSDAEYSQDTSRLNAALRQVRGRFLIGGPASTAFTKSHLECDHIFTSVTDAMQFIRSEFNAGRHDHVASKPAGIDSKYTIVQP
jgi:methanogenic corrinoid protein MtbC1